MISQKTLITERLILEPLSKDDNKFIFELVNTPDWIRFIGDKKVYSESDAALYIQKIIANENTRYWTVRIKDLKKPIGLITLIKRDYLEHRDIGFAFLPTFYGNGYAYEAAHAVLMFQVNENAFTQILAITLPDNTHSIKLLRKLRLQFQREIEVEKNILHVYSASIQDYATV